MADAGMYFFDYGNAFLLEARRAGADVSKPGAEQSKDAIFREPIQDFQYILSPGIKFTMNFVK